MARGPASPNIYFISSGTADLIWKAQNVLQRIINTGVVLLKKHAPAGVKCAYRPCQEVYLFIINAKIILLIVVVMTHVTEQRQKG